MCGCSKHIDQTCLVVCDACRLGLIVTFINHPRVRDATIKVGVGYGHREDMSHLHQQCLVLEKETFLCEHDIHNLLGNLVEETYCRRKNDATSVCLWHENTILCFLLPRVLPPC